jgi:hypothetical protein
MKRIAGDHRGTDREWFLLIWAAKRFGLTIQEVRNAVAAGKLPIPEQNKEQDEGTDWKKPADRIEPE